MDGRAKGTALLVLHDDAARVIPVATPLEVIFVETPVSRFSKLPKTLVAPATARPASVTINRAVPTFGWNRTYTIPLDSSPNSTHSTTSTRDGATLRIYLERPWWSSGVGEKLGVVYYPGGENATADDIPAALVPFVTQWGADPTVSSPALPTPLPIASAFPNAVGGDSNLFLDEVPHIDGQADQLVAVAAHEVAFDIDQNLWYADVRIAAGSSYHPFVRLALARYQPVAISNQDSTDDCHLSRVVLADILQLSPNRTATVSWAPASTQITVRVTGDTYQKTAAGNGPGVVTVTLQRKLGNNPEPELGWSFLSETPLNVGASSWSGTIPLRQSPADGGPYRLVISQFDVYPTGDGSTTGLRLVHMDTVLVG